MVNTCSFVFFSNSRTARPGMFDLKGKAKWDSWNSKQGMSKDEAKRSYIARAATMVETYGKN